MVCGGDKTTGEKYIGRRGVESHGQCHHMSGNINYHSVE